MKKILFAALIVASFGLKAQKVEYDWKNMDSKQRKELINNLSPEERKALYNKFRNNMVLDNLDVAPKDKTEFLNIYNEYIDNQKKIKGQFDSNFKTESLSDEEAKSKLQQSFDVGQKLLENRKKYAEKLQQVIPPQKVLKLFQSEGMMRDKMNNRKPNSGFSNGQRPR